jgi:uncharacterized phage-associated protein
MRVSAHDVARELRNRIPGLGDTNVHKMLYYAQGWSLARTGNALFDESIEAWTNGPVVATLWHDEDKQREIPPALDLDEEQMAIIDEVVERYGHLSARKLSEMTHEEPPWRNASAKPTPNPPIRRLALMAHFATVRGLEHAQGVRIDPEITERAAAFEPSIVTDPDKLPPEFLAQIDEDLAMLEARRAERAS